jgi:hypothetical protein
MLVRAVERALPEEMVIELAVRVGTLNRDVLGDNRAAFDAFRVALERRPRDVPLRRTVAELATIIGQLDAAAEHQTYLLKHIPDDLGPLHELLRIFCAANRLDPAWCISQALMATNEANAEEQSFYEVGVARHREVHVGCMTASDWRLARAHGDHAVLSDLLGRLEALMVNRLSSRRRRLGLRSKDLVAEDAPAFALVRYVTRIMGVPQPAIWRSQRAVGLTTARLDVPILIIGPDFEGRSSTEQAFMAARGLFVLRGPQRLIGLANTAETRVEVLRTWLATAHRWMDPDRAPTATERHLTNRLEALPTNAKLDLWSLIGEVVRVDGYGLERWLIDLELTASRLGLLISNHLMAAVSMLETLPAFGPLTTAERVHSLTRFSVSEDYFELRRRLGYAIAT